MLRLANRGGYGAGAHARLQFGVVWQTVAIMAALSLGTLFSRSSILFGR